MVLTSRTNLKKDCFHKKYIHKPVVRFGSCCLDGNNKAVSVIIITYNHINYIEEAIQSVLNQRTNFDFEIIIVDDSSIDGTTDICKKMQKQNAGRVTLYVNPRENNIKILNKPTPLFSLAYALFLSKSEYVAILSGDDYWTDSEKLQKQYNVMKKDQNLVLSYTPIDVYSEIDNRVIKSFQERAFPIPSSWMIKNISESLPPQLLEVINEDRMLWEFLKLKGQFLRIESIKPTIYRVHGSNMWSNGYGKKYYNILTQYKIREMLFFQKRSFRSGLSLLYFIATNLLGLIVIFGKHKGVRVL